MGSMHRCNDDSISLQDECIGTYNTTGDGCWQLPTVSEISICESSNVGYPFPRQWGPPPYHFDNVLNSLLTVWEVATGEMWPDIMYEVVDAVGPDLPQERDNNPAAALYFIAINIVFAFFMLEIFTGIVIDNFNSIKEKSGSGSLLSDEQKEWVMSMKLVLGLRPKWAIKPPSVPREPDWWYSVRLWCFNVAVSKEFEWIIMGIIMLNTGVLAARTFDQSTGVDVGFEIANLVFAVCFFIEAVIKLIGLGPTQYFSMAWNIFDFALVIGSIVGVAANFGSIATLLRVVRVARVVRLVRVSKGL